VSVNNDFAVSDGSIYAVTYKMDDALNSECTFFLIIKDTYAVLSSWM